MKKRLVSLVIVIVQLLCNCCITANAEDSIVKENLLMERSLSLSKISLFAKTGGSEFYTLYPEGVEKEDAYIGGFKSAQLDPLKENLYFYDTGLKVISRINIKDGKVYKVIGKPKSIKTLDYKTPVSFNEAELGKLIDFTFDKYGNIYILDSFGDNSDNRILKASIKDKKVSEISRLDELFLATEMYHPYEYDLTFSLTGLSKSSSTGDIYFYGNCNYSKKGYGVYHWQAPGTTLIVLKFNPQATSFDIVGGGSAVGSFATNKIPLNPGGSNYFSLKGLSFDHENKCYVSVSDYTNSQWISKSVRIDLNLESTPTFETFIGNDYSNVSDLGDGGLAENAYAGLIGSRFICCDVSGDIYVVDNGNNRIRKIFKEGDYITTVVGGGTESLSFGDSKSTRTVSLSSPHSLAIDKANNLFIVENNRILLVRDLITHESQEEELVKVANLTISKLAGIEVEDPKGEVSLPDLKLDYTYAGDRIVEVKGLNIPDGTNIKLLGVGDSADNSNPPFAKLSGGIASVPLKIDAGSTKVIKAETDPFIPAPGVYLPGTEPMSAQGELLAEPENLTPFRSEVNKTKNFLSLVSRFNFLNIANWQSAYYRYSWAAGNLMIKPASALDPDNLIKDATLVEFGPMQDSLYLNNIQGASGNITFSIWMRTDSENLNVPIGTGPTCNSFTLASNSTGCSHLTSLVTSTALNTNEGAVYKTVTVTPAWQKFTVTATNGASSVFIGGLGQTTNKKIYLWGVRLEQSQ